jgi:hypothetical protein
MMNMSKAILDIRNGNKVVLIDVSFETLKALGAMGYDVSNPTSTGKQYGKSVKMLTPYTPQNAQAYMQELANLLAVLDRFSVSSEGDFKMINRSELPEPVIF